MKFSLIIFAAFLYHPSRLFFCKSFRVQPASLARSLITVGPSKIERQRMLPSSPLQKSASRVNLLSDSVGGIVRGIDQRAVQNATATKDAPIVSPTSVALGSIATLSAGTVFWALLKDPVTDSTSSINAKAAAGHRVLDITQENSRSVRQSISAVLQSLAGPAALPAAVFLLWKFVRLQDEQAFRQELNRVKRYKEEMYFEAVQEIFVKLNRPDISFASSENLKRQLIVLDPDGSIRKYVISGGKRPDISDLVAKNSERYAKRNKKNALPILAYKPVDADVHKLLKKINSSLGGKYDTVTLEKIAEKIKKSFSEFSADQAKQALDVLYENVDNELYWTEFVDKLT